MSDALIQALQNPELYDHPTGPFQVIETHISRVLLTGDYAYKIKKAVDFGFLNFTTLEQRRHFCEEELRLNRRLAGDLYEAVVPITGSPEHPQLGGEGEPFEYAIRMRQFDQAQLLDQVNANNALSVTHIDALADTLAHFHAKLPSVAADSPLGTPPEVLAPMLQNVEQIRPFLSEAADLAQLEQLEAWTQDSFARLQALIAQRRVDGFVRECHGDLHLGNITLRDGQITIFDCIEFSDSFRWIDTFNDLAFLLMDLQDRDRKDLAWRLLNRYLESSGDYAGLPLLGLYIAYRALVRAKIALFTRANPALSAAEQDALLARYRRYANLAEQCSQVPRRALVVTSGVSGSGKSRLALTLAETFGGVRIRSDVERKRLFGLQPLASSQNAGVDLYTPDANQRTYEKLATLARDILAAGYSVAVDAACLRREERARFVDVGEAQAVPVLVLWCNARRETLVQRLTERAARGDDPSEAGIDVMQRQLGWVEPLSDDEPLHTLQVQTDEPGAVEALLEELARLYDQLA